MSINLTLDENKAIEAMDEDALRNAIEKACETRSSNPIAQFRLSDLGPYVGTAERNLCQALDELNTAKSTAKITRTKQTAIRAGLNLISRVREMKQRARQEKSNGERFYIDDYIHEPFTFRPDMSVTVSYRWRAAEGDDWTHGRITFCHRHVQPQYESGSKRRSITVRQRERNQQEALQRKWCNMRDQALYSVRDFFHNCGNGADIPDTFNAITDRGSLNNFSLNFWRTDGSE